jgi:hypothetical protein
MSGSVERADEESRTHPTTISLSRPPAAEVDAGIDIVLKVKLSCPQGCDLRGQAINVIDADGAVIASSELSDFVDNVNETAEFAFKAPDEIGEHSWTVVFRETESAGLVHAERSLPIAVRTLAHDTSLAVWGVLSPVVINHPFRVHVGATCSSGCDLAGGEIEVRDDTGGCLARGTLGSTPWDGTRALYWTEVDLVAPLKEGATSRSVTFAPAELRLPHDAASAKFGFETVRPPECSVTVKVVHKDSDTPVEDAQIRLGVYFGYSDPAGVARVALPRGTYHLDVLKTGYEDFSGVVDVNGDLSVEVQVGIVPSENPDAYWLFDPSRRI